MTKEDTKEVFEQHDLQREAEAQMKEDLRLRGLEILKTISKGLRERKAWIAIRESQIKVFEELRTQLFDAYGAGDEYKFESIAKNVAALKDHSGNPCTLQTLTIFEDI